jgi:hypothetical protein
MWIKIDRRGYNKKPQRFVTQLESAHRVVIKKTFRKFFGFRARAVPDQHEIQAPIKTII